MMRYTSLIITLLLMISCSSEKTTPKKPNFIIGKWMRLNDKPNHTTKEYWNANFTGIGFTLKEKDTIFREHMSIISKNDTLFLKVIGVNEDPTFFKFTQQTDTSFVCENPNNEFPTKILYYLENHHLKATVSNKDFAVEFEFSKIK